MNGLHINIGFFKDKDIKLIQKYWDELLANGYEIVDTNILGHDMGNVNESFFIVNSDQGYIKHKFREIVVDKEVNLVAKFMVSGLKSFENVDQLKERIDIMLTNRRIDLVDEINFFNISNKMLSVLEEKGYQIIPFVGYQIIKITDAEGEEKGVKYRYQFDYNLRKIRLYEETKTTRCASTLYYDDFQNLSVNEIFKMLYYDLPTQKNR
ncbi:hypothetical protein C1631_015415 [Chryseobacterium phosphatilyticum]|uniref:Uncharacterized protein n=1 Tax=Chryseobacterium phosphatilyticum TaxID=475075 RepID=A0A316X6Z3_9FLAO|nr:hypothetical protein [Chryseobacterium phosphatilyticum]PWN69437.1 hypothetical protein C1631_015415 [Chryseobacterium phosphatilyticum]